MEPTRETVVVLGAGAAGLSAAGALAHRGIQAVVLEQDEQVGGTWARRYDRLHLHTIRRLSGLAHFPIPGRYPTYLSRDELVAYLAEYTRHFGLRVVTGTTADALRPSHAADHDWMVTTARGETWH